MIFPSMFYIFPINSAKAAWSRGGYISRVKTVQRHEHRNANIHLTTRTTHDPKIHRKKFSHCPEPHDSGPCNQ